MTKDNLITKDFKLQKMRKNERKQKMNIRGQLLLPPYIFFYNLRRK
jgi:hypothetical protein